jgi:hypothetical protein
MYSSFMKKVINEGTSRQLTSLVVARVSDGGSYLKGVSLKLPDF